MLRLLSRHQRTSLLASLRRNTIVLRLTWFIRLPRKRNLSNQPCSFRGIHRIHALQSSNVFISPIDAILTRPMPLRWPIGSEGVQGELASQFHCIASQTSIWAVLAQLLIINGHTSKTVLGRMCDDVEALAKNRPRITGRYWPQLPFRGCSGVGAAVCFGVIWVPLLNSQPCHQTFCLNSGHFGYESESESESGCLHMIHLCIACIFVD